MSGSILRVPKTKTWDDNWNDVILLMFNDQYLKELMCVPIDTELMEFVGKYFINGTGLDELVTTESVRISWHDGEGVPTNNGNVKSKTKEFDIYVKDDVLRTATEYPLRRRSTLITERLKDILLTRRYICGLSFRFVTSYDAYTKSIGYSRYRVVFSYKVSI